jgi:predicted alpha/beta-fold hydrolase
MQTLWGSLFRIRPRLELEIERLELPDGDFVDLAWSGPGSGRMVLILHGLEGTLDSHYAGGLLRTLNNHGFRTCFMHFRGCSGEINRLPRSYHSGETGDLQTVVEHILQRGPLHAAVGFSLGGNVLLKWLGEQRESAAISTAIAVSVPFRLADAAQRLEGGLSRVYQHHLLTRLKRKYRTKFKQMPSPLQTRLDTITTFYQFDDAITAPLHGFTGADDYYSRSSSFPYLKQIRTPTLIIHALDDPFMWPHTIPGQSELSPAVTLELARHGGHVGFITGLIPGRARYWLDMRIIQWLGFDHF